MNTTETELINQPETEPETPSEESAEVSVAVGLALLRASLDGNKGFTDGYGDALLGSPYAMSLIDEVPKAYLSDGFLEGLIRVVLRAQGQTENESESADVTALVAAAKKEVEDFLQWDDLVELVQLAKYMFVAGRLSHMDETRPL